MTLPNRERAIISSEKLTEYLLNTEHRRGASKARLLKQFGYSKENWKRLASDIRTYHLEAEVDRVRHTSYGVRYEIVAELLTPRQRGLLTRSIWQIDESKDVLRFVTMIPE
jgi:hypothetical protein